MQPLKAFPSALLSTAQLLFVLGVGGVPPKLSGLAAALPVTAPLHGPCPHHTCTGTRLTSAHGHRWPISVEWPEFGWMWDLALRGRKPSGIGLRDPLHSQGGTGLRAVNWRLALPPRCHAGTNAYESCASPAGPGATFEMKLPHASRPLPCTVSDWHSLMECL